MHSALVKGGLRPTPGGGTRPDPRVARPAIRAATRDACIALCFALAINCAILVLAAAAFHAHGRTDVIELEAAHQLLAPTLGGAGAGFAFAFALLLAGVASAFTGTLAGQVVMEGFLDLRIAPWLRRLGTRLIAVVPALLVTAWAGEARTAELLIASQVVLSLQLPFALIPLMLFTTSRRVMGELVAPRWVAVAGWGGAAVIVFLNLTLLARMVG